MVELAPPASFPRAGRQVAQGLNGEARRDSPGFNGCVHFLEHHTWVPTESGLGTNVEWVGTIGAGPLGGQAEAAAALRGLVAPLPRDKKIMCTQRPARTGSI